VGQGLPGNGRHQVTYAVLLEDLRPCDHEFGDLAGYLTGWSYWISSWAGNAAIVASWVFYVEALFNISHPSAMTSWGIALLGLWIPAAVNLAGVRQMAWFQNTTVVLKFLPLLFVGVVGWFFVTKANFGAFNASGGSLYSAIGIAAGMALFSFIGVEVAAMTAKQAGRRLGRGVRDRGPERVDAGDHRSVPGGRQRWPFPAALRLPHSGHSPWRGKISLRVAMMAWSAGSAGS
jgi:hypothetical protein